MGGRPLVQVHVRICTWSRVVMRMRTAVAKLSSQQLMKLLLHPHGVACKGITYNRRVWQC